MTSYMWKIVKKCENALLEKIAVIFFEFFSTQVLTQQCLVMIQYKKIWKFVHYMFTKEVKKKVFMEKTYLYINKNILIFINVDFFLYNVQYVRCGRRRNLTPIWAYVFKPSKNQRSRTLVHWHVGLKVLTLENITLKNTFVTF
jgi:hypothetical protein